MFNVFDTANKEEIDVVVVFHELPARRSWLWNLLEPGFRHVQVWTISNNIWVQIDGCMEFLHTRTWPRPPWELIEAKFNATYVPVKKLIERGVIREPFHFGPVTCVELAKAVLGIRKPFIRTPYQLYKFLKRSEK